MSKLEEYLTLYLGKAEKFGFKPANLKTRKGQRQAIRYLLACGFIPFNKENVALVGKLELYISAEHLPASLKKTIEESAHARREDWQYVEDFETEELKVLDTKLNGVWMRQSRVISAAMSQEREIRVTTFYRTPELDIEIS